MESICLFLFFYDTLDFDFYDSQIDIELESENNKLELYQH